jgi:hypothetical protein
MAGTRAIFSPDPTELDRPDPRDSGRIVSAEEDTQMESDSAESHLRMKCANVCDAADDNLSAQVRPQLLIQ